ncbi:hypothetical protein CC79DRAFT_1357261 [Sarocladium strictum]
MKFKLNTTLLILSTSVGLTLASPTANEGNIFEERACTPLSKQWGCTDGFCWKRCSTTDDTFWCWTARNSGEGNWRTCDVDSDCGESAVDFGCGQSCSKPSECGCGC